VTLRRLILAAVIAYASWLGMMATHELGHVLHAMASGGKVTGVSLPLLGFSQTFVRPNPREHFVVWGGPLWGAALPALACVLVRLSRRARRAPALARFFAGFCLIANGVYIGVGWVRGAGDTGDLLRLGTPVWAMVAFGVVCSTGGLAMWHTLGSFSGLLLPSRPPAVSARPSGPG